MASLLMAVLLMAILRWPVLQPGTFLTERIRDSSDVPDTCLTTLRSASLAPNKEIGMALRVMSVTDMRLEVLLEAARSGETGTAICERLGISRETYYVYLRRHRSEGVEGLEPRSRQPRHQPQRMPTRARPHQGIADATPAERYRPLDVEPVTATPESLPDAIYPPERSLAK
jgi:transposase-like protein